MPDSIHPSLPNLISKHQDRLLTSWLTLQSSLQTEAPLKPEVMQSQSLQVVEAFLQAAKNGNLDQAAGAEWTSVTERLTEISSERARLGATPAEVASFVFSLKQPVFDLIRKETGSQPEHFVELIWQAGMLLDKLGLITTEAALRHREDIISRQQTEMLELSTPVVKLWDGILALPLIGTLDSQRTQVVMETLLNEIVKTGAGLAIIDITGVPTVDTLVAQHLMKTVAAARLMGAECIVSGIRPQIAATIVHLGVDLGTITTKATLADAFGVALSRLRLQVIGTDGAAH